MFKPTFKVLGLSIMLAIASGCGRGFEAIKPLSGDKNQKTDPQVLAEQAQADFRMRVNEKKLKADIEKQNLKYPFVDDEAGKANQMIQSMSATKRGTNLYISAVVKSNESAEATDLSVNIDIPMIADNSLIQDGVPKFSSEEMVGVTENAELNNQFQAFFLCENKCGTITVRFQRYNAEDSAGNYAATFEFKFTEESDRGDLVASTLKREVPEAGIPAEVDENGDVTVTAKRELEEIVVTAPRARSVVKSAPSDKDIAASVAKSAVVDSSNISPSKVDAGIEEVVVTAPRARSVVTSAPSDKDIAASVAKSAVVDSSNISPSKVDAGIEEVVVTGQRSRPEIKSVTRENIAEEAAKTANNNLSK